MDQTDDITALAINFYGEKEEYSTFKYKTVIENKVNEIDNIIDGFESFSIEKGINIKDINRINIVFDELLNNIMSYGYIDNYKHQIIISVELYGSRLIIKITDDGIPFNPFSNPIPDTTLSIEDRDIGGLGVHIVRDIMDEVTYQRKINLNFITLIKMVTIINS